MDHARSIGATVKHHAPGLCRSFACILLTVAVIFCGAECVRAQSDGFERTFPQSKASVEKALKAMQSSTAGRLPVLNGFASAADHSLDSYQRGFYQAKFQVSAGAIRRIDCAGERGNNGVAYRPGCGAFWLSVVDFEWPPGSRSPGSTGGSTRRQSAASCDKFSGERRLAAISVDAAGWSRSIVIGTIPCGSVDFAAGGSRAGGQNSGCNGGSYFCAGSPASTNQRRFLLFPRAGSCQTRKSACGGEKRPH